MPYVHTSSVANGDGTYTGHFYYRPYGASADIEVALPAGVTTTGNQPFFFVYRGRLYILGLFTPNLVFTEHNGLHTVGIQSPLTIPVLNADGSGQTIGEPVSAKMWVTFAQKENDQVVHEGNPSGESNTVEAGSYGFALSSLPLISPDARVNTIRGWRSVDGAQARLAWERPLGQPSVVDNVPTGLLGELMTFSRGVPPQTSNMAAVYDERTWWVDPAQPQYLNYSLRGEPESTNPLSRLPTKEGERITGVFRHWDQLLVGCPNCFYDIQRYGDNDYAIRKISTIYGLVSPWSFATIGDTTWFWTQYGPCMYAGGQFVFVGEEIRDFVVADYAANQAMYERGIGTNDPVENVYTFMLQRSVAPKHFSFVGAYLDVLRQGRANPRWGIDKRNRLDTARAVLQDYNGRRQLVTTGSEDGISRYENVTTDATDDGDTFLKSWAVQHAHEYFELEGSNKHHGKKFTDFTVYLKNENQAARVKLYAGNDQASLGQPRKVKNVPAGVVSGKVGRVEYPFPLNMAGEGLTCRVEVDLPKGIEYRGYAGAWIDGVRSRPAT